MKKSLANLVLKSSKSEINKLEKLLLIINKNGIINQDRFINFHIAASEALINAIIHGNKESPEKKIFVDIEEDENDIILTVKDEGEGFDIGKLPDPTEDDNLVKDHGRGVFIMKQLTDKCEFFTSDKGTTIKLSIKKNIN